MSDAGERNGVSPAVAPLWHTVVVVVVLLLFSVAGTQRRHLVTSSRVRLLQYSFTLFWQWLMLAFVLWGARKSGTGWRELIGRRWRTIEDALADVALAFGFWLAAMIALGAIARALHLSSANQLDDVRRQLGFLVPRSSAELMVWGVLSASAGFCEEIVFRGYLQRQFAAFTRNAWLGIAGSALVFGAAHGYEGPRRMILVGFFGAMFGILAYGRRSLVPGMMAHAFHDAIAGLLLRFFLK